MSEVSSSKKKLRVAFVTRGGPHLASYRLRIEAPGRELGRLGVEVSAGGYLPADVHVFSKHWDRDDLGRAKDSPCAVFDICDDHFAGEHGDHYRAMCAVCHVVVSSIRLGEIVERETGKKATYIPEPYELPEGEVKEPGRDPTALWFGHASNLVHLRDCGYTGKLLVCSNAVGRGIVPYTPDNLRRCLEACDFVLIPQNKDWKSANRMVESLRAGRFVIASDIPAYRGFSQYLGDIPTGVEWLKNAGAITERIISGRKELSFFSPESVGRMWYDFISGVARKSIGDTST